MNRAGSIRVNVLLFAAHREALGESRLQLEVPRGTTLDGLYALLSDRQPSLAALRPYTTFAVNREVAEPSTELRSGDEVALLQPVSGG